MLTLLTPNSEELARKAIRLSRFKSNRNKIEKERQAESRLCFGYVGKRVEGVCIVLGSRYEN